MENLVDYNSEHWRFPSVIKGEIVRVNGEGGEGWWASLSVAGEEWKRSGGGITIRHGLVPTEIDGRELWTQLVKMPTGRDDSFLDRCWGGKGLVTIKLDGEQYRVPSGVVSSYLDLVPERVELLEELG